MDLSRTANIDDLRELARRRLPRIVFDFFDGGAEDEVSLRDNRKAFERMRLSPRVLRDVAAVDASTEILGGPSKYPLVIAPVGGIGMGWPGGDLAIARTAASYGIPFTLSTAATVSIEEVAEKAPGRLWFQLYVLHDREFTDRLVERAHAAGYEALVVTVDLPVGGKRERDTHNGLDPAVSSRLARAARRHRPSVVGPAHRRRRRHPRAHQHARIRGPAARRHDLDCVLGRPAARCLLRR